MNEKWQGLLGTLLGLLVFGAVGVFIWFDYTPPSTRTESVELTISAVKTSEYEVTIYSNEYTPIRIKGSTYDFQTGGRYLLTLEYYDETSDGILDEIRLIDAKLIGGQLQ